MQDNNKLYIALLLMVGYGSLVILKLADSSGFIVLLTYAIKKLMDMHEDNQGGNNVPSDNQVLPKSVEVTSAPKV